MKVKIIDILNRIAQKKNVPEKIKYYGVTYELQIERLDYVDDELNYFFDYVDDELNYLFNNVLRYGVYLFQHLNDEVEILDNKTDEIEEYTTKYTERIIDKEVRLKINELVKAINKLNKQDTAKETNCMTD